jgi:hypothetical protein
LEAISETDDPEIIAAAQTLYARGGTLIGLASADVRAIGAIRDLASAASTFGSAVAADIKAEQQLARVGGLVLADLSAADVIRKASEAYYASEALAAALGAPQQAGSEQDLNKFYNALLDFFDYTGDALTDLLESSP